MKTYRLFIAVAFMSLAIAGFGQKLEKGNVVGLFTVEYTLEEGMTFVQFEKLFLEEYIPALEKNFPGIEVHLLKGERGERTGKYTEMIIFDSLKERNSWWPEQGKSAEVTKKAFNSMREIQDRMQKMISSATFTDYIVL